jgi:hypothetical protein
MLRENLKAQNLAHSMKDAGTSGVNHPTRDDLQAALDALASMIERTEEAQGKFPPGTSQHSLLRNRLRSLRAAEAMTRAGLDRRES